MSDTHRLVGVAAPQRQQQQVSSTLFGGNGVIQASSVGPPLQLIARSTDASVNGTTSGNNSNSRPVYAISSRSANVGISSVNSYYQQYPGNFGMHQEQLPPHVPPSSTSTEGGPATSYLRLDNWQQQATHSVRVPLASPEGGGPLLSSVSPLVATRSKNKLPIVPSSSTSRSYVNSVSPQVPASSSSSGADRTNEGRFVGSVSGALPSSQYGYIDDKGHVKNKGGASPDSNSAQRPAIIRPQTFHATSLMPFPSTSVSGSTRQRIVAGGSNVGSNSGSALLMSGDRPSKYSLEGNNAKSMAEGGGSSSASSSDNASTVTNASVDDDEIDPHNLDYSGITLTGSSRNGVRTSTCPTTQSPQSSAPLPPLELVEQLNKILTIGDIAISSGMDAPAACFGATATSHTRRGGLLLDDSSVDSLNRSPSQHSSPRSFAARRLRSISMPLVHTVGPSSRSHFDSVDSICGERLPRHIKAIRHVDLQSVKFSVHNVISILEQLSKSTRTPSNLNTTTGASAATLGSVRLYDDLSQCGSTAAQVQPLPTTNTSSNFPNTPVAVASAAPELRDPGDGRSNAVVQSCPYFRNEISTEELRSVHLGRATVAKQMQKLVALAASATGAVTDPQGASVTVASLRANSCGVPHPICNGITILDSALVQDPSLSQAACSANLRRQDSLRSFGGFRTFSNFVIEHHDFGAHYYRHFFCGKDHKNYLTNHPVFGPLAVSLLREKCDSNTAKSLPSRALGSSSSYQHKLIVRTVDLVVLRGVVRDDQVPVISGNAQQSKSTRPKFGCSASDIISFLIPELNNAGVFRLESDHEHVSGELLKIDEQNVRYKYKVGVIFCRPGQTTEEEYYNNPSGSDLFESFLNLMGQRVSLKNFAGYNGGLDTKQDTTGSESIYASFAGYEVMFHVSTLLPFSPTNPQQLLRKRHIGNDVVTIIFQEPGSQPFTPRSIRSQYQHVFIIVRPVLSCKTNGHVVGYQVAVSRAKDVPYFGPLLPPDGLFSHCPEFGHFLLIKCINAENAVVKSGKFVTMSLRTRRELLLDVVNNYAAPESIMSVPSSSSSGFGSSGASRLISRLSFRRVFREKAGFLQRGVGSDNKLASGSQSSLAHSGANYSVAGGFAWNVVLVDCGQGGRLVQSTLVVSTEDFILLDRELPSVQLRATSEPPADMVSSLLSSPAVFCVPLRAFLGYRFQQSDLRLYYHKGESILLRSVDGSLDELEEIVARLTSVAGAVEYVPAIHAVAEIALSSPHSLGRFGFLCSAQGVVLRVDEGGPASEAGLRAGYRIIEVFGIALRALTGAQLRELFQSAHHLRLSVLPPLPSGAPRQSRVQPDTPTMYWLPQYFHSMSTEFLSLIGAANRSIVDGEQGHANDYICKTATTPKLPSSVNVTTFAGAETSTPVSSMFAANRIYAELPAVASAKVPTGQFSNVDARSSNSPRLPQQGFVDGPSATPLQGKDCGCTGNASASFLSARSQTQSTESLVEVGDGSAANSTTSDFFTPSSSRRPVLLPATTDKLATAINTSNYQLHRCPMNNNAGAGGAVAQKTQVVSSSGELVDVTPVDISNGVAYNLGPSAGLLEAQLAVERSRRLAAEHELALAQSQLTEMRSFVRRFADWFLTGSSVNNQNPLFSVQPRPWQSNFALNDDAANS